MHVAAFDLAAVGRVGERNVVTTVRLDDEMDRDFIEIRRWGALCPEVVAELEGEAGKGLAEIWKAGRGPRQRGSQKLCRGREWRSFPLRVNEQNADRGARK